MTSSNKSTADGIFIPYSVLLVAGLASAAVALMVREQQQRKKKKKETTTTFSLDRHYVVNKKGYVSTRGKPNLALHMDYLADHFICISDPCHPETNPHGHITLTVAENKLVTDLLHQRLATTIQTAKAGFDHYEVYGYNDPQGLLVFRQAIATLLEERFWKKKQNKHENQQQQQHKSSQQQIIDPKHIAIGAGVVNILSSLVFALGNSDDAVMIPVPYYAAFDNDLRAFAGCKIIPVHCKDPTIGPTPQDLQQAKDLAEQQQYPDGIINIRFLLLTHPNNPLGVVYQPQILKDAIEWARSYEMDTIVDEIYALSVFDDERRPQEKFQSVIEIYDNSLGNDIHFIWGLSKDFGASGFRVGVLYTQNEVLMEAMSNLLVFAWVSLPIQRIMTDLINDKSWVDMFLKESSTRLKQNYNICTKVMDELQIPYVAASAGIFFYLDLSKEFNITTQQEESLLGQIFMKRAKMVLTPGSAQHDPQPGKFRICYAYQSPKVLQIGMERFHKIITTIRRREQQQQQRNHSGGSLGLDSEWIHNDAYWKDII